MKKGLSTNKSMSAFYGRVINAVESEDVLQVIKTCAGRLSYLTLCKVIGCGIPVSGEMIATAIKESAKAQSETEYNNLFYSTLSRQIGMAFCHNLHDIFADKSFEAYVLFVGANSAPCGVRIFVKGAHGEITADNTFDMNTTMSGDVVAWLSER